MSRSNSSYKKIKPLTFVSVEGFWEKNIHDQRVAEAAEKLHSIPYSFAIATATHAPSSCVSFTDIPLGKYTANKLIKDHNIESIRILPAYLFPQKTTYTIIDAYSNAIMISWICCGLSKSKHIVKVVLEPVTAGYPAQAGRILALNKRALQPLKNLSIESSIHLPQRVIPLEQLLIENPEEAQKLKKLGESGSVIETGIWDGNNGIKRSFDNIEAMRDEVLKGFNTIFGSRINYKKLFSLSNIERLLLTLIWNIKANSTTISSKDWSGIYKLLNNCFEDGIENTVFELAKNELSNLI